MINSFLTKSKILPNHTKFSNINNICQRERRYNNGNYDAHILRNIRQKKNTNNHKNFTNNEDKIRKKLNDLSKINSSINTRGSYQSKSRPKNEEGQLNNQFRKSIKTNNHNYYNTNSFDAVDKNYLQNYSRNTYDIANNLNNIKLLDNEVCTPRIHDRTKCFLYQKNYNDLSKTLNTFKNRENYGYREIKDVKKNNYTQIKKKCINTDRKENNVKLNNNFYISISNNNSLRNYVRNNNNDSTIRNSTKNNIIVTKSTNINQNDNKILDDKINNNEFSQNKRKFSYINFKTDISSSNNNMLDNKDIKEKKDNKISYKNRNFNKSLLMNKVHFYKNLKEENRHSINTNSNSRANYIKRSTIEANSKEKGKKCLTQNRFFSGDLKDVIKIANNRKNQIIIEAKQCSPIKKQKTLLINEHMKHNSLSNTKTDSIDKDKIKTKQILKYLDKNTFMKRPSTSRLINKSDTNNKISLLNDKKVSENNIMVSSLDKKRKTIVIKTVKSKIINNEIIKDKIDKLKEQMNSLKIRNQNLNNLNNLKKYKKEYKDSTYTNDIDEANGQHKSLSNSKIKISNNNNIFNKLSNDNKEELKGEKIKKFCRSSEKSYKKNKKTKKSLLESASRRSRTKSKAKKHSSRIKYIDKLKIFKYSDANFNYTTSTNSSKDNFALKIKRLALRTNRIQSKKKKNINSLNLNYKSFEEDFKVQYDLKNDNNCQNLKPQISCRITLTKKNNVNIIGILRYFKVNYITSENLRNKYDIDSEDTSEYYNSKF
jgi:hypothetical protein